MLYLMNSACTPSLPVALPSLSLEDAFNISAAVQGGSIFTGGTGLSTSVKKNSFVKYSVITCSCLISDATN